MSTEVLLDTSFLITLVNAERPNHGAAKQYYRHLLGADVPMRLSSIVAAEFAIKQPLCELPLNNFRALDFNLTHGQRAAEIWNALGQRDPGEARTVVRDDVKLLAQASREGISFILTEDASSLHKYCERLRAEGHLQTRTLVLTDGFDPSALREDGQRELVGMDNGKGV